MVNKKREKEITPEQMKEKFRKEFSSFWLNSEVLFGANLFPVANSFSQEVTIIFLLDASDFTTERVCEIMQSWSVKYSKLPWTPVIAFQQKYAFMKNSKFLERYRNQKIYLDVFGDLFERFGSGSEPVAVLLKNGELISSMPLLPNISESLYALESELQKCLRLDDPGLPLPVPEKWAKKGLPMSQNVISAGNVTTSGEWNSTETMLFTENNNTTISVPFKGKHLRMIAMAHPNALEPVKASITFNEKSLYNGIQGPIVHDDNTGASIIEINKTIGNYDMIQSDHEISGIVKITFTNVYDVGVIFYGFRIA
jgi:hypothetical protein